MPKGIQNEFALQNGFTVDDHLWSYDIPHLRSAPIKDEQQRIKSISLVSDSKEQRMILRLVQHSPNRAVDSQHLDRYLAVSFEKFRLQCVTQTVLSGSTSEELRPVPAKESAEYIVKLLRCGVHINGVHYNWFGHSNSQLKSKTCYLYAGTKEEAARKIESLGKFPTKSVAKNAKRIGLLFSAATIATTLQPDRCQDIADICKDEYMFTDGCGLVSVHFAKTLVQRAKICFRNQRYTPSVFQIRYRGYKGVLTLHPELRGKILVQFRESMNKFAGCEDLSFSVVDYSKPYGFGFLNDESILLLHALGISPAVLLRKQQEHLDFIASSPYDARNAFRFLSYLNEPQLAEKVLVHGLDQVQSTVKKLVNSEFTKLLKRDEERKSRILIPQSRLLFGICDPVAVLRDGECALRVTMEGNGTPETIINTEVLVTRNPCLHPGDLQKFRAVQHPRLSHLVDCIIFPTKGRRPSADLMSGGDLDGDKFFVTWDRDLIPSKVAQAANYQGAKEPISFAPVTHDDRLVYFAKYTNASLGRVKKLYLNWARLRGPMSPESQELNHLFSHCVDGHRIKIPPHLEDPPKPEPGSPPFILDLLHEATRQYDRRSAIPKDLTGYVYDAVELLLSRENVAFSEFELLQMTARWCSMNSYPLMDFFGFFDFSQMSTEQQRWIIAQSPVEKRVPSLISNALMQSSILSEVELDYFKLNHAGLRWKPLFDSSHERLGRLMDVIGTAFELFEKKLIVVKVTTRLTIAIYFPSRSPSMRSAWSTILSLPTKVDYRLYYDDTGLQLYEKKRGNTWVFMTRPGQNDKSYKAIEDRGDRRRVRQTTFETGINHELIISIALNKFSGNLAKHMGRVNRTSIIGAEVYVISNRDVRSLQVLDKWLEFVDTREVMPIFERPDREYTIPMLRSVDWTFEPNHVKRIVVSGELALLDTMSPKDVASLLAWLSKYQQIAKLHQVYVHLLQTLPVRGSRAQAVVILGTMIDSLELAPSQVIAFSEMEPWQTLPTDLQTVLSSKSPELLQAVCLAANEMQILILAPFRKLLAQVDHFSMGDFASLIETIALAIRDSETALDLLMGCLQPESDRLLGGTSSTIDYLVKNYFGIAMEHLDEANESRLIRNDYLELKYDAGLGLVKSRLRIDSHTQVRFAANDHVRLTAASLPSNSLDCKLYSLDAMVEKAEAGSVMFRCLHPIPSFLEDCSWTAKHCGSFVTCRAMLDAVTYFATVSEEASPISAEILGLANDDFSEDSTPLQSTDAVEELNDSQNQALQAALTRPLTCIWGPPGTGKTHTVAVILTELLKNAEARILVTAPTHNAVDNVMRKFLQQAANSSERREVALRVSTDIRKVAPDLQKYTCDAMMGKDLNEDPRGRKNAQKRIKECRLIFTTCIGAALGLLRTEYFNTVIIDEASQQTEPQSLVPLAKGCSRAILVGDQVQLRATVQQHAQLLDFDVSLFERLYTSTDNNNRVAKVMLDTQYRMQASICQFSSTEFYQGRLRTAVLDSDRPLQPPTFPWPAAEAGKLSRMFFVQCSTVEDLGQKSKSNQGQANLCRDICKALLKTDDLAPIPPPSVAVLAPYSRQVAILKDLQSSSVAVNSIDGFQGREADVVVYTSTRCNVHAEIGFLKDLRRLNVVLTRAKSAFILVGDRATLTGGDTDDEATRVWKRLLGQMTTFPWA